MKVAIIGRPNVGKSTIFNRLTGKKHALTYDLPGVTRDRREGSASISDLEFTLIDTAGLENSKNNNLKDKMFEQTIMAVDEADLILMVIDGIEGIVSDDLNFIQWIRQKSKPTILLVNKCEGKKVTANILESYKLGLGEPVCISAEHGEGMADLYRALEPYYKKYKDKAINLLQDESQNKYIQVAIVGRPNAGKSTLVNALIDQNRLITGPEAGMTRDSISINWKYKDKNIRLIDTAGIRKRSNINSKLEKLSVSDTLRSIRFAHTVILLIDAITPLDKQDLSIADMVIQEGRNIVIAINKWDLVPNKDIFFNQLKDNIDLLLPQIKGVPLIYISAIKKTNIDKLMDATLDSYKIWNKSITTGKLNNWLQKALEKHPLPMGKLGRRLRIKYITQNKTRPPSFLLFSNTPEEISDDYIRYLVNGLRKEFNLPGVPIRINFKKSDNPYQSKT